MKFEYIGYRDSLIKNLKKDTGIVYVFSDFALKNYQKKESNRNIFEPDPLYLTLEEFKDRVFKTDRVILSEAKRHMSLYNLMRKEFSKLKMDTFFETIEFSDKFFRYYTERNRALYEEELPLESWQNGYFSTFHKFKNEYDKYLDTTGYIPKDWIECERYIDIEWLKKYDEIYFIDIVEFTNLEKKILKEIDSIVNITIRLQMTEGEFDEELLELKETQIPNNFEIDIKVGVVDNKLEMINLLLGEVEKREWINIFSPESEKNEFSKIYPSKFMKGYFDTLNNTKFYKFLELQSEMIASMEHKLGKLIPINKFIEIVSTLEMREYYEISILELEYLYRLQNYDYKYIGKRVENEKIYRIYKDIVEIYNAKDLDYFIDYFKNLLENKLFNEKKYIDFYGKLQEYIGYAKTTEEMLNKEELRKCFKNGGEFLKFFLHYFNRVELREHQESEGKYLIKPLEMAKTLGGNSAIFINMSDKYLPNKKIDTLTLTEKQRKDMGFITYDKLRRVEKYRFYQSILKYRDVGIIYIKNESENEDISPFISELKLKFKLKNLVPNKLGNRYLDRYLKNYLKKENIFYNQYLEKEIDDFEDSIIRVGAYDFQDIQNCSFKYYLKNIAKISPMELEESMGISLSFLGRYIHSIYEKIVDNMWKRVVNFSNFELDSEEIDRLFEEGLKENRERIPVYMDNYFERILIPRFKKNIYRFFAKIDELYGDCKIKRLESEKRTGEKEYINENGIGVTLVGRVDLVIESEKGNHIIDFKSGTGKEEQLDFYNIMLYGEDSNVKKTIYNVFEGKFEDKVKVKLDKKILEEVLLNFLKSSIYELSDKKSECLYCVYGNICGKEF